MSTVFKLKNNTERSFGFAGKICIAGSGNPTPAAAAKQVINGVPFRLPPLFELNEAEMFRSYRGIVPAMVAFTKHGRAEIEVFVEGVAAPLTVKDIEGWAADYRDRNNLPQPATRRDHTREVERAMARPEDPIELQQRQAKQDDQTNLVKTVTAAVLAVLRPEPAPPAPPAPPLKGRNDEAPEDTTPAPGRARPRA